MMKQFKIFLFAILMTIGLSTTAWAAHDAATAAADLLYEMGLLQGIGTDEDGAPIYALDQPMTREQGLTMFVRLLGKEQQALAGEWTLPWTDVSAWAQPYVGYAYQAGITNGISATAFGGQEVMTQTQYLTFVLRALGYVEGVDFAWDEARHKAAVLGITDYSWNESDPFVRGDAAIFSSNALTVHYKDTDRCMIVLEGCPPQAQRAAITEKGFLFSWREQDTAVVAFYDASTRLLDRYTTQVVDGIYDPRPLQAYAQGAGYYYGVEGLYQIKDGRLLQVSARPVASMIFTREGAGAVGPILLTFDPAAPHYSALQLYGGDSIVKINEDGTETILLDKSSGHGITIDQIVAQDAEVWLKSAQPVGMQHFNVYTYALLQTYEPATGGNRPALIVLDYTAGRPETEEGWTEQTPDAYKVSYIQAEQQRLDALGVGMSPQPAS